MLSQQLVNGLVLSSTYALFALGFTLIFGVLRVINLTYGFYFSIGAFVALTVARQFGANIWVALPVGALSAGVVAVVADWILLTRLRRAKAGELVSLMVTLGAVLALYSLMAVFIGTDIQRFPFGFVDNTALEFGGIRVSLVQMLIVGTTFVLVAVLFLLLQRTKLGLMIRALAENEDAARLMGINVGLTVAAVSFLSGTLGGAAGVLIGLNFNAIQPFMGEHMMLRGFAVIIIGGLGDIRGALIAGVLLGVLEVLTAGYISSNAKEAVAFTILVLTLWFRPVGLFGRAQAKKGVTMAEWLDDFLFTYETLIHALGVNGLLALSMYCVMAVGQLSLGQAAFMGIGAYTGALLTLNLGLPFWLVLPLSALAPAVVALVIGGPTLRLSGVYLAISTIALGEVLRVLYINAEWLTGGALGLSGIPRKADLWLIYLLLFLAVLGFWAVGRSKIGRAMEAMREDEAVAGVMGVNLPVYKMGALVVSAMLAGLAGCLTAHSNSFIGPNEFGFEMAVTILSFALLGGIGTPIAPVIGALVLTSLPEILRPLQDFRLVINGLIIVVAVLFLPRGVIPFRLRRAP